MFQRKGEMSTDEVEHENEWFSVIVGLNSTRRGFDIVFSFLWLKEFSILLLITLLFVLVFSISTRVIFITNYIVLFKVVHQIFYLMILKTHKVITVERLLNGQRSWCCKKYAYYYISRILGKVWHSHTSCARSSPGYK